MKETEQKRDKFYKEFEKSVNSLFGIEKDRTTTAIQNSTKENVLKNTIKAINLNKETWKKSFKNDYYKIISFFYNDTVKKLSKQKALFDISMDMTDYINKFTANKIGLISDTTKKLVKDSITENLKQGNDIKIIENDIKLIYSDFPNNRSKTIAITEVSGISNYGSLMGAIDGGATKKKWIPNFDEKTRPTHFAMWQKRAIDLVEYFKVGNSLMQYPGDSNGSAEEVVNCRCTLKYTK